MAGRSLFGSPPTPLPAFPAPPTEPRIETAPPPRTGSAKAPWSVARLSEQIREIVEDGFPRALWLEGELSQVSQGRGGALYLTFREGAATLEAVAWASEARRFDFRPQQGDQVRAWGRVRTYPGKSRYQLSVLRLEGAGIGALLQELAEREARLDAEGLFDPARKRPLPFLPLRIGLLTAKGSDAWSDFTTTARKRFPGVRIRLRNTPVQGRAAAAALAAGIRALGREPLDVIVVTRGGGPVEDLLPFSDEAVVRAAAACRLPLVSAIGHEQNRPLLDRVADLRVATPTAAAKEILPDQRELLRELADRRSAARGALRRWLGAAEGRLEAFRTHRATTALPEWMLREQQRRAADSATALRSARQTMQLREDRLRTTWLRLEQIHPARKLADQRLQLSVIRERMARLPLFRASADRLAGARRRIAPEPLHRRVEAERAAVAHQRARLSAATNNDLERRRFLGRSFGERLESLDPRAVLRRGYSLALDSGGRAVLSAAEVEIGDRLRFLLGAGELDARVEGVRPPKTSGESP